MLVRMEDTNSYDSEYFGSSYIKIDFSNKMNTSATFDDVVGMEEAKLFCKYLVYQAITGNFQTTGLLLFGVSILN